MSHWHFPIIHALAGCPALTFCALHIEVHSFREAVRSSFALHKQVPEPRAALCVKCRKCRRRVWLQLCLCPGNTASEKLFL